MALRADRLLDSFLVLKAREGDADAFGRLVERWQPKLLAHAWRLTGDRESAKDAVQSAWADMAKGLGRLKEPMAFGLWAYRITSRAAARQARGEQSSLPLDAVEEAALGTADNGGEQAVEAQRLRSAIAALPAGQRAAVALHYLEEMSVAEVAVALAVPVGTVKTRLMHARDKLRASFEGDE
ncbi:RNA polymerase sigma factor [Sphingomicrobium flavum]|uniref:RNA polymerase sigma factor n=1 Tax=Sphingomicrobium flavum TaxID=1229164 RepID=UPI0021ADAB24|nr:sigma-70 family RNA polymerase sigma factor [Sphingomicrobium flavum]